MLFDQFYNLSPTEIIHPDGPRAKAREMLEDDFENALTEHDKQITDIIDEIAKDVSFYHFHSQNLFNQFIANLKEKIKELEG